MSNTITAPNDEPITQSECTVDHINRELQRRGFAFVDENEFGCHIDANDLPLKLVHCCPACGSLAVARCGFTGVCNEEGCDEFGVQMECATCSTRYMQRHSRTLGCGMLEVEHVACRVVKPPVAVPAASTQPKRETTDEQLAAWRAKRERRNAATRNKNTQSRVA